MAQGEVSGRHIPELGALHALLEQRLPNRSPARFRATVLQFLGSTLVLLVVGTSLYAWAAMESGYWDNRILGILLAVLFLVAFLQGAWHSRTKDVHDMGHEEGCLASLGASMYGMATWFLVPGVFSEKEVSVAAVLLRAVLLHPGATQEEITRAVDLASSTVTESEVLEVVRKLHRWGWLAGTGDGFRLREERRDLLEGLG